MGDIQNPKNALNQESINKNKRWKRHEKDKNEKKFLTDL